MRLSNNDTVDDKDDKGGVLSREAASEDGTRSDKAERTFASWDIAAKHRQEPAVRTRPESSTLYPEARSKQRTDDLQSYRRSWSGTNNNTSMILAKTMKEDEKRHAKRFSEIIFHEIGSERGDKSPPMEISGLSINPAISPASSKVSEFPPSSLDNSYYYSSTSSSFQSPIDEQREFSPLNTPSSANTDDFSGRDDSFEGVSTLSPGSSGSLASRLSNFRDSISQDLDSQENGSQTSNDPLIQTPQELSALRPSGVERLSNPSTKKELPSRLSNKRKLPPPKVLSRSRSTGSFSFEAFQTNDLDVPDSQYVGAAKRSVDHSVVGVGMHDHVPALSEMKANNGASSLEVATMLKKASDVAHQKSQFQPSQQQNNTRDIGRNYFTTNLRLKVGGPFM